MKKIVIGLLMMSSVSAFAGSVHDLKNRVVLFNGSLKDLHGEVEFQLIRQADTICGKGNVKRLFNIKSEVFGDFAHSGESIPSDIYPRIDASAKVECN